MNLFRLDPDSAMEAMKRYPQFGRPLSLNASILHGILGFGFCSCTVFGIWAVGGKALSHQFGEPVFFLVCAIAFMALGGAALRRLVVAPPTLSRFYLFFGFTFGAYALVWSLCWFLIRGRTGEWAGSLFGCAAMAWIIKSAFASPSAFIRAALVLFITHSIGYFLGGEIFYAMHGKWGAQTFSGNVSDSTRIILGQLVWGVFYGTGLGAGLGYAFYICQTEIRHRVSQIPG